jgi:hypothetical protein
MTGLRCTAGCCAAGRDDVSSAATATPAAMKIRNRRIGFLFSQANLKVGL